MLTLNQLLHKLHSISNDLERKDVQIALADTHELIREFESHLGYVPDSEGDLRSDKDKRIVFCPKGEQG